MSLKTGQTYFDTLKMIQSDYERLGGKKKLSFPLLFLICRRNPLFSTVVNYRFRHFLYKKNAFLWTALMNFLFPGQTDITIHSKAEIGEGLLIYHGNGIVIGASVRAGKCLTLEHQVTLGNRIMSDKEGAMESPLLGDHVFIGCGAKVLGGVKVGDHARIGANAVVLQNVPDHATAVGVPARVLPKKESPR